MSRQCISLLLSTAMLTGLYGVQAEAASGLTYSLRAEQQVFIRHSFPARISP